MNKTLKRENREIAHFNTIAKNYDLNYGYKDRFTKYKIHKKVGHFLGITKSFFKRNDLNILELGCGTGEYTKLVSKLLPKSTIYAIDISEKMLKIGKNKCVQSKNTRFFKRSAYQTGFNDDSFDVIFGFYVLHHLNTLKTIQEIVRILKPGGLVYFCEPNILNPLVYLIKKNKYLKRIVGDSPDEWGINPIKIVDYFKPLVKRTIETSEYLIPFRLIPYSLMKELDSITGRIISYLPGFKWLGGSVLMCFYKQK